MDVKRFEILLVDDNEDDVELICRSFESQGEDATVSVAPTLRKARQILAESMPDLVVTDLRLPDGDGTELLPGNRKEERCPVLILTGQGDVRAAVGAMKAGAFDCVVKTSATLIDMPHIAERSIREWRRSKQQKRAEAVLLDVKLQNQRLIGNSKDIIWEAHIAGLSSAIERLKHREITVEGLLDQRNTPLTVEPTFVGPAVRQILGFTPDEVLARTINERFTPDSVCIFYRSIVDAISKEAAGEQSTCMTAELEEIAKDGSIVVTEVKFQLIRNRFGEPIGIYGTSRDISERKEMEIALRQSETLYRSLVEMLPQCIFRKDECGRITFASQRFCDMVGRSAEQIIGKTDLQLFPRDLAKKHRLDDQRVMRTGQTLETVEQYQGADKERQFVQVVKIPIQNVDGKYVGVQGIFWDITEQKKEQDELREARVNLEKTLDELKKTRQQVIRQERLRAVGQMASGAAHDLNNALSPVLGYADLLANDRDLPTRAREWIKVIRTAAEDAAVLVDRLRQFYGKPNVVLPTSRVDLNAILLQMPDLTRPKWRDEAQQNGREISIGLDLLAIPPIAGVQVELRQVLTNLVLNAVDALPGGGRITLRSHSSRDSVIVDVIDNGIGMSRDERRHCFEPFFSSKATGSGLGLSVCHGIVERHKGRIELDSVPGHGTILRLVFPKLTAAALREHDSMDSPPVSLARRRILYIDDDARLRSLVTEILVQLEQRVDVAEDGQSGLVMLKKAKYQAVITDLGMSGMDGRQVMRLVRQLQPGTPVIMLTGWPAEVALKDVDQLEKPTCLLEKPPTTEKLRTALASVDQLEKANVCLQNNRG